jgi:hypothetical protein
LDRKLLIRYKNVLAVGISFLAIKISNLFRKFIFAKFFAPHTKPPPPESSQSACFATQSISMTIFRQLSTSAYTFFVFALIELSEKADACKSQATKKSLLPELCTFHDSSIFLFPVFLGLLWQVLAGLP